MKLLFLLGFICFSFSITIKLFDKSGDYILTPADYNYSDNIIIQLWGSGSGSSVEMSMCPGILDAHNIYYPGNSGAYIHANINTLNNETFFFSLGKGGNSAYNIFSICHLYVGDNGNYSTFYDREKNVHFNVSGGYSSTYPRIAANITSMIYKADDIILKSSDGIVYNGYQENIVPPPTQGYGAPSPFGHNGGIESKHNTPFESCDGYMGSGSGYQCVSGYYDESEGSMKISKGGDGALILYY